MKVSRTEPMFTLTFTRDEGWAVAMALKDAHTNYTEAVNRDKWKRWEQELTEALRAD